VKKSEIPRFYGQTNFFLSTLPFSPWAALATWLQGISLVGVPKKVVPLSKSAHVSVSSEFILQILILSSPNVVLTFYTYKVSNKKVSS
jgi:hypothetical protein